MPDFDVTPPGGTAMDDLEAESEAERAKAIGRLMDAVPMKDGRPVAWDEMDPADKAKFVAEAKPLLGVSPRAVPPESSAGVPVEDQPRGKSISIGGHAVATKAIRDQVKATEEPVVRSSYVVPIPPAPAPHPAGLDFPAGTTGGSRLGTHEGVPEARPRYCLCGAPLPHPFLRPKTPEGDFCGKCSYGPDGWPNSSAVTAPAPVPPPEPKPATRESLVAVEVMGVAKVVALNLLTVAHEAALKALVALKDGADVKVLGDALSAAALALKLAEQADKLGDKAAGDVNR